MKTNINRFSTKILWIMVILTLIESTLCRPSSVALEQAVILQTHSGYINDYGYFYVIGEVKNVGSTPVKDVNVTAVFYDLNGEIVALGYGITTIDTILPGRKSPFEITLYSSLDSLRVHSYMLSIAQLSQAQAKPLGLEIVSNSSFTDNSGFHVIGEIKNIGSEYTSFVKVVATFYNASGYVVATKFAYSDPKNLNPGQVAAFQIVLNSSVISKIDHYSLEAESFQYALIPEYNPTSLTLILAAASSVTWFHHTKIRRKKRN